MRIDEYLGMSSADRLALLSDGVVLVGDSPAGGTKIIIDYKTSSGEPQQQADSYYDDPTFRGKRVAQWKQDAGMNRGRNRLIKSLGQ